jgi:hypothetical protein
MPLLFWLLPGGFLIWILAQRHAEARIARERQMTGPAGPVTGAHYPFPRPPARERLLLPRRPAPATTADYLQHLHEATVAAQILDTYKPQALAADIVSLMQAPAEVVQAFRVLSAPLDVLSAQKDLNVLGAQPPLAEDGVPGPETRAAVRSLQARFGEPATGRMDGRTALLVRYSIGCINAQDRAHMGAVAAQAAQTGA